MFPNMFRPRYVREPKRLIAYNLLGWVKCFSVFKGYGFITRFDTNEDVFVHITSMMNRDGNGQQFGIGDEVRFDILRSGKRTEAKNVTCHGPPMNVTPEENRRGRGQDEECAQTVNVQSIDVDYGQRENEIDQDFARGENGGGSGSNTRTNDDQNTYGQNPGDRRPLGGDRNKGEVASTSTDDDDEEVSHKPINSQRDQEQHFLRRGAVVPRFFRGNCGSGHRSLYGFQWDKIKTDGLVVPPRQLTQEDIAQEDIGDYQNQGTNFRGGTNVRGGASRRYLYREVALGRRSKFDRAYSQFYEEEEQGQTLMNQNGHVNTDH